MKLRLATAAALLLSATAAFAENPMVGGAAMYANNSASLPEDYSNHSHMET